MNKSPHMSGFMYSAYIWWCPHVVCIAKGRRVESRRLTKKIVLSIVFQSTAKDIQTISLVLGHMGYQWTQRWPGLLGYLMNLLQRARILEDSKL